MCITEEEGDKERIECTLSESLLGVDLQNMEGAAQSNVAKAQGVQEFVMQHPAVVDECALGSNVEATSCRKDLGEKGKLRHWSRGHVFVVRSCGHVDMWKPIFR